MQFTPLKTSDKSVQQHKVLIYAPHGWGKTTQFKYMLEHYGPGFILSGESGLQSIQSAGIDYLPFTSWDAGSDPDKNAYSFRDLFRFVRTPEFLSKYKWIGVDSLTELSDLSMASAKAEAEANAVKANKKLNGFEVYDIHGTQMIGAMKAIRDLPMHVVVTALAKENQNDNGETEYWPMIAGKQTMQHVPGIFDHVFAGVRTTTEENGKRRVHRYVIADEVRGWRGKVRDEKRRISPFERTGNIVDLLRRLEMSDDEYRALKAAQVREGTQQETDENE